MHGDFTRWTYQPQDGYRSVLLQQGRVLLDADWNEQTEITRRHDEVRTVDVIGRTGGPAGSAAFALLDTAGEVPVTTPWAELRIGAGRYYVDGILAETEGASLADQPFLRLDQPEVGRYAAYLDVWTRQVSADEDPTLRESALGGPDTSTRAQTVWQVRLVPASEQDRCSDLRDRDPWARAVPTMVASLEESPDDADPCAISESGGYQLLENQLYRVQIHQAAEGAAGATFLWSRENGSVVAGLLAVDAVTGDPTQAVLQLDRVGRDEELSLRAGSVLELTSATRQLRGEPGVLALAGAPVGTTVPVGWLAGPVTLEELGEHPIVRRWEGGPTEVSTRPKVLEGGVQVHFPEAAESRPGDYWLVPARTVRLGYGVDARTGTLEWPTDDLDEPVAQPPVGPEHHAAALGLLRRTGDGWARESDCRRQFPALTDLVSLDLLGGDGQEAMPGDPLPQPVRVTVRNGGRPLADAPVAWLASDGGELSVDGATWHATLPLQTTDAAGVAAVRWRLARGGPATQTLTAHRVDDHERVLAPDVIVTGRLSVAGEVAWEPGCEGFRGTRTVQEALVQLSTTRSLSLLGGDGQQVGSAGHAVPQPVRVRLDSPCGPVVGASVTARATDGGFVQPARGPETPDSLSPPDAAREVQAETDDRGEAAFWWQPSFGGSGSDVLGLFADETDTVIRVSAQLDPAGGRTPGVHVVKVSFDDRGFANDTVVTAEELAGGIRVDLDDDVVQASVQGKPVLRVALDLPWPVEGEGGEWNVGGPIGFRRVELAATWNSDNALIIWNPTDLCRRWLLDRLWEVLERVDLDRVTGWFEIDGWAVVSARDPSLHLNGHAQAVVVGRRTELLLPTDDEVAGGVFRQWFSLVRSRERQPGFVEVPDLTGRTAAVAERTLAELGLTPALLEVGMSFRRRGEVVGTDPEAFSVVEAGSTVTIHVSAGLVRGGGGRRSVEVPDVIGSLEPDARVRLGQAGLSVAVETADPHELGEGVALGVVEGQVLATRPAPSKQVLIGSTVTLVVSDRTT